MKHERSSPKRLTVRYGRNHHVLLAIVMPPLLIAPFIFALRYFGPWPEWLVWILVSGFSIGVMGSVVWLAKRVYPQASVDIEGGSFTVTFEKSGFPGPSGFSFERTDIKTARRKTIAGIPYYVFTLHNGKVFQLSPVVAGSDDLHELFDAEMNLLIAAPSA
ncbi:MAG: hypothetical protein ACKOYP_12690 [Bacteroidota bacterium]